MSEKEVKFKVRFSNPKTNSADICITVTRQELVSMLRDIHKGLRWVIDPYAFNIDDINEMRVINLKPIDCIYITRITYADI